MTTNEWIGKQQQLFKRIASGEPLELACIETHRVMANRIFVEGEASNESLIGNYNTTKPIYVNPKNSPKKFPTGGKTGKGEKGKRHKTAFFYSYRDFKAAIGQPTDKVRLSLFGDMQNDFVTGLKRQSDHTWISRFKRPNNTKKAAGMERHFGKKIFALSPSERKLFIQVINRETQRIIHAK